MNVTRLDDFEEVVAAQACSGMSADQVGAKGSLWPAAICQRPAFALALGFALALAEAVLSGGADVARL